MYLCKTHLSIHIMYLQTAIHTRRSGGAPWCTRLVECFRLDTDDLHANLREAVGQYLHAIVETHHPLPYTAKMIKSPAHITTAVSRSTFLYTREGESDCIHPRWLSWGALVYVRSGRTSPSLLEHTLHGGHPM